MVELSQNQATKQVSIYDIPTQVFQHKILSLFTAKELFRLRGVCGDWSDSIKGVWCQVVKEEMLEQVHSLDLLYEKETTAKLLEFKIKYLISYAALMRNYFIHMNFDDIVQDIQQRQSEKEKQILLIACMIVSPQAFEYPQKVEDINDEHIKRATELMVTDQFKTLFSKMCQVDSIPDVSLSQMKMIKGEFIEKIINPEVIETLGNAARLLNSWIDGALEYTILKHEVIMLRFKNNKVMKKIKAISAIWPKKKEFIEGAYKLLLFTKNQRKQVNYTMQLLRERNMYQFMDFKEAINKVLKKWYEMRIQEETDRNKKLRELHDNLTKIKIMREEEAMIASSQTQYQSSIQEQKEQTPEKEEILVRKYEIENQIEELRSEIQNTQSEMEETKETLQATTQQRDQIQQQINILKSEKEELEKTKNQLQQEQNLLATNQNEEEEKQSNQDSQNNQQIDLIRVNQIQQEPIRASVFSSQLLSQILNVGTLFTQKALNKGDEKEENINYDELEQELWRQDIFDALLKKRIFYADRLEKVEKALIKYNLIPKDAYYCNQEQLEIFIYCLDDQLINNVYEEIMNDQEEIWFDIYRSISASEQTESNLKKKKELEVKIQQKKLLKEKRLKEIEEGITRSRPQRRRFSDSEAQNQITQGDEEQKQQRTQQRQTVEELNSVVLGFTAIRYLLETVIQATQNHGNVEQDQQQQNIQTEVAIQTEELNEQNQNIQQQENEQEEDNESEK